MGRRRDARSRYYGIWMRSRWVRRLRATSRCVYCGAALPIQFHHLEPPLKQQRFHAAVRHGWDSVRREVAKVVPVCPACHFAIHNTLQQMTRQPWQIPLVLNGELVHLPKERH